jgi:membrane protease subunit (stomatin/prohibitin family)
MGFFSNNKGILNVIRCDEPDYLIWKWRPEDGGRRENALRLGSSLRVKEGEVAVFVYRQRNGTMQDFIKGPFDERIKTANLPILSSIIGLAYGGDSPFQAEIYFINLAKVVQTRFAVPFFDVFDPRFPDHGVPVAVRGTISFHIEDYRSFIKLHRMIDFDLDTFQKQIRDAISRYIKDAVANAPAANNIPVVQLETKTALINDTVEYVVSERLQETFGVTVTGVDIGAIEIDKTSPEYRQLMLVTKDVTAATVEARKAATVKDIADKQRIEAKDYEESLRIKREEAQYAQHKQTQSSNMGAFQVEKQAEVGVAGANALGQMGANGAGSINMGSETGGGTGFNPAAMMAGMALGGAVGQNIAGTMNGILSNMNNVHQGMATSPVPPQIVFYVAVNGQATGPFDLNMLRQMASSGQINRSTYVWKQGMENWEAAGVVSDLSILFSPAIPPVPPTK